MLEIMFQNIYLCTVTKISFGIENKFYYSENLFEILMTLLLFDITLKCLINVF